MTERFILDDEEEYLIDTKNNKHYDACGGGDGMPMLVRLVNQLLEENEQLKQQLNESHKRIDLISSCLNDEGILTLEKYNEIINYLYTEWKKGDGDG